MKMNMFWNIAGDCFFFFLMQQSPLLCHSTDSVTRLKRKMGVVLKWRFIAYSLDVFISLLPALD